MTPANTVQSRGSTLNNRVQQILREPEGRGQADPEPDTRGQQTLLQDERQDRLAVRAERLADAELPHPLRDVEGEDAVDANRREQERHRAEQRKQHHRRAAALE